MHKVYVCIIKIVIYERNRTRNVTFEMKEPGKVIVNHLAKYVSILGIYKIERTVGKFITA